MSDSVLSALLVAGLLAVLPGVDGAKGSRQDTPAIHLMTLDPGHFHAALVHRETYRDVDARVDVYAPLGPDLLAHLKRVASFNSRGEDPTDWRLEIHTGPDFFERMRRERPGNVVVISGRNAGKIRYVRGSVESGLNVLVDKPWILEAAEFPALQTALDIAEAKGLVAFDMMTERFEVTTLLQRTLVSDPAVFGEVVRGTPSEPGVYMESVHHLMKTVAGAPNIRPAWFFDTAQQGEGLNDIGTHLVDLVQWTLFPGQAIDFRTDLRVLAAQRWPTLVSRADFERVTGEKAFPEALAGSVRDGRLEYFANTLVGYAIRGVNVTLNVIWDWEAPPGRGDAHFASYRGTVSRIEVRQGAAEGYRPEVYVTPAHPADLASVRAAVVRCLGAHEADLPGVGVETRGGELRLRVPDGLRVSHEEHFGQVARLFFSYVLGRTPLPAWEKANMLAKYWVTTTGTELSRQGPPRVAERRAPQ
jgi:predicted dehydrogenase